MRKSATRKILSLAVVALACLLGLAPAAQAAPARADVPTCLIANGGGGGGYTKAVTCVELVAHRYGDVGSGRYIASWGSGRHVLTVTVEYRRPGYGPLRWLPLASAADRGRGTLFAVTRPVRAPHHAATRACVVVTAGPHTVARELCTR